MAVSGLEQRFAPLVLTQPVWSPWGIGVTSPWSSNEDDVQQSVYATEDLKPKQKELTRSRSWGGLASFVQNAHYAELLAKKVAEPDNDSDMDIRKKDTFASTLSISTVATDISETSSVSDLTLGTDFDDSTDVKNEAQTQLVKDTMAPDRDSATTIAVRNLPFNVTREELLREVDGSGFADLYDYVYLPHKFKEHRNLGFAFLNFLTVEMAQEFHAMWHKSRRFAVKGCCKGIKPLNVTVATLQGKEANAFKARGSKMVRVKNSSYQPLMLASAIGINN